VLPVIQPVFPVRAASVKGASLAAVPCATIESANLTCTDSFSPGLGLACRSFSFILQCDHGRATPERRKEKKEEQRQADSAPICETGDPGKTTEISPKEDGHEKTRQTGKTKTAARQSCRPKGLRNPIACSAQTTAA
jgi:hypothetical protein